ncbi:MAG: hypothetical protein ACOX52_16635 [Verrucomicrobiota bacterium]
MPTRTGIDPDFDFDFDRDNDRTDRQPLAGGGVMFCFRWFRKLISSGFCF